MPQLEERAGVFPREVCVEVRASAILVPAD